MKRTLTSLFFLFGIGAALLSLGVSKIIASGDQDFVVTQSEDGTMYVTTTLNQTLTSTPSATTSNIDISPLKLPNGFFPNTESLINRGLQIVMAVGVLLVFAYLILGAFGWITSGGEKGKIDSAKNKMIAAVIGLIILSSSYAILRLAIGFLGFTSLSQAINNVGTITGTPGPSPSPTPTPTPPPTATSNPEI